MVRPSPGPVTCQRLSQRLPKGAIACFAAFGSRAKRVEASSLVTKQP